METTILSPMMKGSEGAKHFGVIGEDCPDKIDMEGVLKEGRPIICSMRPGDFTTTGTFYCDYRHKGRTVYSQ